MSLTENFLLVKEAWKNVVRIVLFTAAVLLSSLEMKSRLHQFYSGDACQNQETSDCDSHGWWMTSLHDSGKHGNVSGSGKKTAKCTPENHSENFLRGRALANECGFLFHLNHFGLQRICCIQKYWGRKRLETCLTTLPDSGKHGNVRGVDANTKRYTSAEICSHLQVFDGFAHHFTGVPLQRDLPNDVRQNREESSQQIWKIASTNWHLNHCQTVYACIDGTPGDLSACLQDVLFPLCCVTLTNARRFDSFLEDFLLLELLFSALSCNGTVSLRSHTGLAFDQFIFFSENLCQWLSSGTGYS